MTLKTLGMGIAKLVTKKGWKQHTRPKLSDKLEQSFRGLEKKVEKVGKERKIRIEKQKKEYFDRTGKKLKIEESE